MTSPKRALFWLAAAVFLVVSCSSGEPAASSDSAETPSATAANDPNDSDSSDSSATPGSADEPGGPDDTAEADSAPVPTPGPTLADADLASLDDVEVGEQVRDEQGNLIAIYGFRNWSTPFGELTDQAQADFSFFGDVDALADPSLELIALDVGMCSAGIDAAAVGTAEFFVHDSPDHVLSSDRVRDRGVLARHPVVQPGFQFPRAAECTRGWLPVLWSGVDDPTVARYVLTTRESPSGPIERHVYQWDLELITESGQPDELFGLGQTVTFNDGLLEGTTVVVDGWAEIVGAEADVEGTRIVSVSLSYCPVAGRLPQFGLAVDGWNVVSPRADSDLLGARSVDDASTECFDGWLEFGVPFGGIPTGFFVSDGVNANIGYAEWSLENGALPAPS